MHQERMDSSRDASFVPLTPTLFLDRSAKVYADRLAVVDGEDRWTYREFSERCLRLSGALKDKGLHTGDRVAILAPNGHLMLEAHYGVLYAGMVIVALNTRLAVAELEYIIGHADCRVIIAAPELLDLAYAAVRNDESRIVISGGDEYENLLSESSEYRCLVDDERSLMALNYTSGTTGSPKGVMYHHRGAYLQSLAMVAHFGLTHATRYLWTLPMFHCNGWAFTWAVTACGGTHVCIPRIEPENVWALLHDEGITHFCAAPTVMTMLAEHAGARSVVGHRVVAAVGGAPPTPALLERCALLGLDITHLYGLTETFGPLAICDWREEWDELPEVEKAVLRARQGVGNVISLSIRVLGAQGLDVPADGSTLGEVAVQGNNVMLGYYLDPAATALAIPDGWFRTGDLGVLHPDGYLEIRDRSKDVIISGGENISSVEVEAALASHPAVLECAVIAVPNDKWGERPVAYVTTRAGQSVTESELRQHVRDRLASFKVPDQVFFGVLPKTATGKIRKVELRERIRANNSS